MEVISPNGACTCGEERCVHRMAREFERIIDRVNNGDTQGLLRREPVEMLLAATVISAARASEERTLAEAMYLPVPTPSMPYASVLDALQHHQRVERAEQERGERKDALRLLDHRAYFTAKAFACLLHELGVVGREEVFSYSYRGRDYRVAANTLREYNTVSVQTTEEHHEQLVHELLKEAGCTRRDAEEALRRAGCSYYAALTALESDQHALAGE